MSAQLTPQSQQQAQARVKSAHDFITSQQEKRQVVPKAFTDTSQCDQVALQIPMINASRLAA